MLNLIVGAIGTAIGALVIIGLCFLAMPILIPVLEGSKLFARVSNAYWEYCAWVEKKVMGE